MVLLSVVVVVKGTEPDVEACIRSLLDQRCADAEFAVVGAPGSGPLDELAERDRRLRIHRPSQPVGVGAARELAVDLAGGEYVWVLEPSDVLRPGMLGAVVDSLRSTAADVLLVPQLRLDARGRDRPGSHAALLRRIAAKGPAPLDRHPGAVAVAPTVGSSVIRRALLQQSGARFSDGLHGELTATWPALLTAERIAAMPEPAYVRRSRPEADPRSSPFEVFERYDDVLAFAEACGERLAARQRLLLPAMVRHELALLRRLHGRERREFVRRMSEAVRRHRGTGDALGQGRLTRLEIRLLEQGRHRTFLALLRALGARGRARRLRVRLRRRMGWARRDLDRRRLERYYRARRRRPVDPGLAVFAAYWYRGYACNPRAIYEKSRELIPGFRGIWVVKRSAADALPPGVEYVIAGTREYYDLIARAGYFVNNVNFPNHLVKRDGTVHVMTHHGTPLKHMGLDLRDARPAGSTMDFDALLRRCSRWDFSVSSNQFSTRAWERAYPTDYESLDVGYPRNDVLVQATDDDVRRIREGLGVRADQIAVLYAPTHREYQHGYVPTMDIAAVADALGEGYVVLARLHYFYDSDPAIAELHRTGRLLDVASHPSVEELCLAADVLVTDYSSIMFDYAVLDRPIIIHAARLGAVSRHARDLLRPHGGAARAPSSVPRTKVVEALLGGVADGEAARRDRAAFRSRFCAWDDGHAAERVVRRVWLDERDPAIAQATAGAR